MSKKSPYQIRSQRLFSLNTSIDGSRKRLPSIGLKTIDKDQHKRANFDRYYIHPTLRYRPKSDNPKANPENYQDETFIYKNLHNQQFWNWVHPLQSFRLKSEKRSISNKINIAALEKFRAQVTSKGNRRVPRLVQQLLHEDL